MLTLTRHDDDRPAGAWCLGVAPAPPHYVSDGQVTREPAEVGPALCRGCLLRHRQRLDAERRP